MIEITAITIVGAVIALLVYFLPTAIAKAREHKDTTMCFWINLLLGWSGIVWVVLLVWSILSRAN